MSPFEPVGEQARWRIIYDMLEHVPADGTLTYEEMGDELDVDPVEERHIIQMAMRRAAKELETTHGHAVDAVPNVGYRVVHAEEHLGLARRHQKKSSKSLVRGQSKVVNVDLTGVDPEVRKAFQVMAAAFSMQLEFNRRTDVRQKRLEESLEAISQRSDKTEEELAALKARLDKLDKLRGE